LLSELHATAEQRGKLHTIADAAHADLQKLHQAERDAHQQWLTLFTQVTVDSNAIESQRMKLLGMHDELTRRQALVLLDASLVLTPSQRQELGKMLVAESGSRKGVRAERPDDCRTAERPAGERSRPQPPSGPDAVR
jgi:Spy/CpxP family protein refolding chaperone